MALLTYSDLLTSTMNWLGRPNDPSLPTGTTYDDFVTLFENDASTRLRTHFQETNTTITTIAATASYALPADFMEARELTNTTTDPHRVIDYYTPALLDRTFNWNEDTGEPLGYTIEGTHIRFAPTPDAGYAIRLEYLQSITPLATSLNWLYQKYPLIYLYGSIVEALYFLGADDSDTRMQIAMQRRDEMYTKINLTDRKFKTGGAPLRMKLPWMVP